MRSVPISGSSLAASIAWTSTSWSLGFSRTFILSRCPAYSAAASALGSFPQRRRGKPEVRFPESPGCRSHRCVRHYAERASRLERSRDMRKAFEIGGLVSAAVLIVFGVVAIVMGVNGRDTVNTSLQNEYIVGSSDMTPSAIKAEAQKAGIASSVNEWPTTSVANQNIDTGAEARAMAQYMHIHSLEATGGYTYAQMRQ